jgi:hypothetical protein
MGALLLGSLPETFEVDLEMTLLYRPSKAWERDEVTLLLKGLRVPVSQHLEHPHHLAVYQYHEHGDVSAALADRTGFALTLINKIPDPRLPFRPFFGY